MYLARPSCSFSVGARTGARQLVVPPGRRRLEQRLVASPSSWSLSSSRPSALPPSRGFAFVRPGGGWPAASSARPASPASPRAAASLRSFATDGGDGPGTADRPPKLPSGAFRPKQSLGQNYLQDQNYVLKITNELRTTDRIEDGDDDDPRGQ